MLRCVSGLVVLCLVGLLGAPAKAASPVDVFSFENETQEERYRRLIEEIRCPKCMNTNIAGSDATSAQTLRAAVHRLIVEEGKSDAEVLAFLQDRYGDFVLYDPPLNERTWLIWSVPLLLAGLIGLFIFRIARASPVDSREASLPDSTALASLDEETRDRLEGLLSRKP